MEPQHIRFGGGAAGTVLHPLVAVEMVLIIVLISCLPRKYAIAPLLLGIFTIPMGQVLVLGGVHFTMGRILILTGLVRRATERRSWAVSGPAAKFNSIDWAFTLWALSTLTIFSLQWMDTQALIRSLGDFLDAMGGYFVSRFFIQDREDVQLTIKVFACLTVILGVCMINEQITRQNIFGLLSGGSVWAAALRDGAIRSQGTFEVYITAGVFGATLLPLFIWLWSDPKSRVAAGLGMIGATAMTITSNSSTPLLAYLFGIVGLCFWPLRNRMRSFRWGLGIILVVLHLSMKAPVWALIARIDLTGSSSGYHRYMLVDNCIRHFGDWWLLGFPNYDTWGWDMWDLSNQYVACALTGGLATLVFFIFVITRSFGRLGTARKLAHADRERQWLLWCFGAALLCHVVSFFGIGYFDQMQFAWYTFLAMVSVVVFDPTALSVTCIKRALTLSQHHAIGGDRMETSQ